MATAQDQWSNIPLDLAGLVLKRLPAHVDRVRFAAVCPQWRSAARQAKLPPPPPLLALKDGDIFYSMPRGEPLHFTGCEPGFATASGSWLVYRRSHCLLLVDPFSGATMTLPAPSRVHFPAEDESDDSSDGHDSKDEDEGAEDDHDEDSEDGHDSEDGSVYMDKSKYLLEMKYFEVIKLMVCSPDLIAALFEGRGDNWIAVCRPGGSKWSVAWHMTLRITDMVFYQGNLYVVDKDEGLLALDIIVDDKTGDPWVSWILRVINVNKFDNDWNLLRMVYLVESCGSLLLVRRRIFHMHIHDDGQIHTFAAQGDPGLLIFKADFARSQWVKATTLADNQAIFLGPCSRAVCMPPGDSLGNRLWFLDDYKDFHMSYAFSSVTSSVANPKPLLPLPMISWRRYNARTGAAWLFPTD